METGKKQFDKALERKEVRCPACGKLLLKGEFKPGTSLYLRCRSKQCGYHDKDLKIKFL